MQNRVLSQAFALACPPCGRRRLVRSDEASAREPALQGREHAVDERARGHAIFEEGAGRERLVARLIGHVVDAGERRRNRRGHRPDPLNPGSLCYSPTAITTPVNVTVKVFVQGTLAKIDGTNNDAIFTTSLTAAQTWKPATLRYDGVWRVSLSTEAKGTSGGSACTGTSTCTCANISNPADPYCGTSGAACKQRFPN